MTIIESPTQFSLRIVSLANPPSGVATAQVQGQADSTGAVMSQIQFQATELISDVVATVTIPVGTILTDEAGAPLTGPLTVNGAYFSPTVGDSLAAFPGGFSADHMDASGQTSPAEIISAGLMSVEIADASGRQARNFGEPGIQIEMEIPTGVVNPFTNQPLIEGDMIPAHIRELVPNLYIDWRSLLVVPSKRSRKSVLAIPVGVASGLWDLGFPAPRCLSRLITVLDRNRMPVCSGKMRQLRAALVVPASGYQKVIAPFSNGIQFFNAPQVNRSEIRVFRDANVNNTPETDEVLGSLIFAGAPGTEDNLCPNMDNTDELILGSTEAALPGSCL